MLTLDQARSKMLEQIPFPTQTEYLNLQEFVQKILFHLLMFPLSIIQRWMVMLYVYQIYNNL